MFRIKIQTKLKLLKNIKYHLNNRFPVFYLFKGLDVSGNAKSMSLKWVVDVTSN